MFHRLLVSATLVLALVAVAGLVACGPQTDDDASAPDAATTADAPPAPAESTGGADAGFAEPIEKAHRRDVWSGHEALAADVSVRFGGNPILDGRMVFDTPLATARIDRADGAAVIFDGSTAWVTPADAEFPRARFHVLTWPYFLAAPMKLSDPGTHLEPEGERTLDGTVYDTARLTFDDGVGDAPDDWYLLYRDQETGRLEAMAYIVTYGGTSREEAEADPHAITYDEFTEVDGVPVPVRWSFWLWNEEQGIHGDPIGSVELANVEFVTPDEATFEAPEDAREITLPEAG